MNCFLSFIILYKVHTQEGEKVNYKIGPRREGDPDFIHDAARIYVSMKTLGDINFKTAKTTQGAVNDALKPETISNKKKI